MGQTVGKDILEVHKSNRKVKKWLLSLDVSRCSRFTILLEDSFVTLTYVSQNILLRLRFLTVLSGAEKALLQRALTTTQTM